MFDKEGRLSSDPIMPMNVSDVRVTMDETKAEAGAVVVDGLINRSLAL